jgi:exonuclease III
MQGLLLAHLNIQGLENRLTQLNQVLISPEHGNIDLLALTETWENHDNSSDYSMLKDYKYIGKPNPKTSRGVGFLISNKISH